MMPQLHRVGLHLRPIAMADAPAWFACLSSPDAIEYGRSALDDIEVLCTQIAASNPFDRDAAAVFAIVDDLDELIGAVGFHTVWRAPRGGELAYNLHPAHWGRGIASEVCQALAHWAFAEREYRRIDAYALDSNAASLRVLEKSGFAPVELQRGLRTVQGRARDFWLYRRECE